MDPSPKLVNMVEGCGSVADDFCSGLVISLAAAAYNRHDDDAGQGHQSGGKEKRGSIHPGAVRQHPCKSINNGRYRQV